MRRIIIITFIALAVLVLASSAKAISIGVKPKEINIAQKIGERKIVELLIKNTDQEPAMYKVYPDKYQKNIRISPSEFKLDSNEEKVITITACFWCPGKFISEVAIVARPLNIGGAVTVPGIKIPFAAKVTLGYFNFFALALALLIIAFLGRLLLQWKRGKKL
ncbi:MAG: hypothetical protein NTW06_01985 [Candidatus Falkowbacteria bacterium]|nr:hypothetical protein [Candidatus Falkowbacteria bacterium]